jgi:hypothetical protein
MMPPMRPERDVSALPNSRKGLPVGNPLVLKNPIPEKPDS